MGILFQLLFFSVASIFASRLITKKNVIFLLVMKIT